MYPYVALCGPTYRENSHANHTWHRQSHQTGCSKGPEDPSVWVRFPSPAPLLRQRQTTRGAGPQICGQNIDPMGKSWEIDTEGGGGLMASRIPALPQHSHVQSRAAVHKNKLCDPSARAIACGWIRTHRSHRQRQPLGIRIPSDRGSSTLAITKSRAGEL